MDGISGLTRISIALDRLHDQAIQESRTESARGIQAAMQVITEEIGDTIEERERHTLREGGNTEGDVDPNAQHRS